MDKFGTYETILPRIYAYTTPGITYHEGWLKIGYTATQTVDERIKQINHTGWIIYNTEWTHPAPFDETLNRQLTDKDFHKFLTSKYKILRAASDLEWFKIDADTAKKYLEEFCAGKTFREPPPPTDETAPYTLRTEQLAAVSQTVDYWLSGAKPEFLWNAKPRFGKNLTVYEFVKEYDAAKVLIVTNRPAIAHSWYADFEKFTAQNPDAGYIFTSNTARLGTLFDGVLKDGQRLIAFISLQDLKTSKYFSDETEKTKDGKPKEKKDKLDWIENFHWDILVVDESHEGIATEKTKFAFKQIKRDFTLYLSGTPFRAIANEDFSASQIFNWSYYDEQECKRNFAAEPNPYADLPRMNLYSYRLSDIIAEKISAGTIVDAERVDFAFDLNEFFRTNETTGKFVHESDVKKFLDALTSNEKFPFSTPELRAELRHTFWLLQRVDSAKAMAKLLRDHKVFRDYEIIVAAGDGKLDEHDVKANAKSLERVTKAIAANDKTITLSVGQLTTGVTVPKWTAVLMLSELKSATQYIQTAFRAQNPHRSGNKHKTNCYVFDFNPARALEVYANYAKNICGGDGDSQRVNQLLNFFPVLAEDDAGKMVPLDAEKIMSLPQSIKANQIVESGFMSNLIFNSDNIIRVFGASQNLLDIVNKLPRDDSPDKKSVIVIDIDETTVKPENVIDKVKKTFECKPSSNAPPSQIAQEIADAVKEEYKLTKAQTDALAKRVDKKIASDTSAENIASVQQEIILELENKKADAAKRSKESEIRAHLRGFARTIPSFIMAYGDRNLTLANFDTYVDDKIFEEVTSITLDEFRALRSDELFNEKAFNAAVQKFFDLRDQLADYFAEGHDKDIFSFIPPQNTRQIFTPKAVVVQMVDALEREKPGIFDDPAQKFIDPYIKSGMFVAEIVRRLFRSPVLKNIFPDDEDRLAHILTQQVYGFAPSEIIRRIATNYIFGSRNIPRDNFVTADLSAAILSESLDLSLKKNFSIKVTVLNTNRVKKFGEVFTPEDTVNEMLDSDYLKDIWKDPYAKILEPTAGRGAFLVGILKRKLSRVRTAGEKFRALASIYAIELQLDNLDAAKLAVAETFAATFNYFSKDAENFMWQILDANIVQGDIITTQNYHQQSIEFHNWTLDTGSLVRGKSFDYAWLTLNKQFAIILGNPPYQLDTKGDNKTYAAPVYHRFLQSFWERCDRVLMIHPARCLFRAGGTPKDFIDSLLNDDHIQILRYEANSKIFFPNLDIKGGIAITYRDANRSFGKIGVFIPFPELKSIFYKVTQREDFKPLSEIMRGTCIFHFTEQLHVENPTAIKKMSKGHDLDITTDAFENFPDIFLNDKPNDGAEYIQFYGLERRQRVFKWIRRSYVREIPELLKYKVMIPAAYGGAGALREKGATMLVGLPLVGLPLVGYTDSFIGVYKLDNGAEALAAEKYIKTKFARALLGVLKVTQHATPDKWKYVPQQDFGAGSDVPWGLPVAQIDAYLYEKYQLTAAEIEFIEANVKEMN